MVIMLIRTRQRKIKIEPKQNLNHNANEIILQFTHMIISYNSDSDSTIFARSSRCLQDLFNMCLFLLHCLETKKSWC